MRKWMTRHRRSAQNQCTKHTGEDEEGDRTAMSNRMMKENAEEAHEERFALEMFKRVCRACIPL